MADLLAQVKGFPAGRGVLDLEIHRGDIVLLRGPNGSGKTSLLRALAGLPAALRPGRTEVLGIDPASAAAARLPCHLATQDSRDGLVGLTVQGEFALRGLPLPPPLHAMAERSLATLSSGQARRLALAIAQAARRPLLLLDEPGEGLDPAGRALLVALVQGHAQTGAVVVADHLDVLATVANRTVELGPREPASVPIVPRRDGPPILSAPPVTLRRQAAVALPGVAMGPGLHAVAGPNGSGKSTLLLRLAGLLGTAPALLRDAPARPGHDLRLLLPRARDLFRKETVRGELAGVPEKAWSRWGLQGLLDRHPLGLSGGEAQRLALAKCLGREAAAYLLDEPESHLDSAGRRVLMETLAGLAGRGACVVVASHDPAILGLCRDALVLEGGP
jgi:energy-coupling factor transporter ATP-binding protein EcfA2